MAILNTEKQDKAREEFRAEFEKNTGDKLVSMDLAEIRGNKNTFDYLKLPLRKAEYSVWGILIEGEKSNYFFKAATDETIMGFVTKRAKDCGQEDVTINLSQLKNIKYSLLPKKWWDFLFPEKKRMIDVTFESDDGENHLMSFIFAGKADEVYHKLHQ